MIKISLTNPVECYRPGQLLRGQLKWNNLAEETTKVELRLIWYTQGKGNQDFGIASAKPVFQPSREGQVQFQFKCPSRPFSFSGRLIKLRWALEAIEFPSQNAERQLISISPTGNVVKLHVD
ncbi:MAG: hypothetical protein AAGA30_01885 [Planctomycetota bacterium]